MNRTELREKIRGEIVETICLSLGYVNEKDFTDHDDEVSKSQTDAIMSAVQEYVAGVIGEDLPEIPHRDTGKVSDAVKAVNYEKAEERRRAGIGEK